MSGLRQARFRLTRHCVAGTRQIGRPVSVDVTILDYGNGTLELDCGAAFRTVNGQFFADGDVLQPGASFVYGRDDEFRATVETQLTPWCGGAPAKPVNQGQR
ncbi:hypothetical protein [Deinococcus multiflagellatus]|uniref:Uncharacterized protein n=1 Tax=Deinococcus multiflagellatus TaxID=1656887 RepID=A0ABW1ZNH2_9DEIO|nr:hypothetical protein [Deinococcus multiflagellatus]MBZ9715607.1 hypothetical protein [Deinococcus multiflagellatus]